MGTGSCDPLVLLLLGTPFRSYWIDRTLEQSLESTVEVQG